MANKQNHSNLRALISIKNLNRALDKHYEQMIQIEKNIEEMNENASLIIENHCPPNLKSKWYSTLQKINKSITEVNTLLKEAQVKVVNKDKSSSFELWEHFDKNLDDLNLLYKSIESLGIEILPENIHQHWRLNVCNFDSIVLPLIVSHANACRAELDLIRKYTPEELDIITQIIINKLPDDFTFEEADKYEADYLNALSEFKNEFKKSKNLWDNILDVLAGGTHQPPSERVMMQRWLEGEKHDL